MRVGAINPAKKDTATSRMIATSVTSPMPVTYGVPSAGLLANSLASL